MAAEFGRPPEPTPISRTHYIDPFPEINAAFEETNTQAREQAETGGSVRNMQPLESTEALEGNPACPTCSTTLQEVL